MGALGHRTALLMLVPLVVLAGCGSRLDDAEVAARLGHREVQGAPGEHAAAAPVSDVPAGETASPAAETGASEPEAASRTTGTSSSPVAAANDSTDVAPGDVEGIIASVDPKCVERPGTVLVTIQTVPFADVSFAASFPDGDDHGQWGVGVADQTGRYRWTIAVDPTVGSGDALAIAAARRGNEGGSGMAGFRIATAGGCS